MRFAKASVAVVCAASMALTACGKQDNDSKQNAVASGEQFEFHSPGGQTVIKYAEADRKPVQNFSGESLMEPGKQINLTDYDGQVVVLNAWGQWCAPCRAEVDDLGEVRDHLKDKKAGTVLGINVRDFNPQISRDFVKDNGIDYPSIYDPPFKTASALGGVPSSVIPTTIVLDQKHRPAAVFLTTVTAKQVNEVVDDLVEHPAQ